MAALESAALSGSLFRPRSHSTARSASTASPTNTDDELASDLSEPLSSFPVSARNGPQTGPKGVIEDRRSHVRQSRLDKERAVRGMQAYQERRKMVGMTSAEDDEHRKWERLMDHREMGFQDEQEDEEGVREGREETEGRVMSGRRVNRWGKDEMVRRVGLREVGKQGFVSAVERPGWVVILIYEPDMPRCSDILTSLLYLSTTPHLHEPIPVSLIRARARTLEFSLMLDGEPDLAVLPTILAYRDGELERTWIRVDWEVGEDGVHGLLQSAGILSD